MRAMLLWGLFVFGAGQAFGHARLTHSDPADGGSVPAAHAEVTLQFSEAIQPRFSDFVFHYLGQDPEASAEDGNRLPRPDRVFDETRQQVTMALSENAPAGWYVLDWEVLAVDGHTTAGTLRFLLTP